MEEPVISAGPHTNLSDSLIKCARTAHAYVALLKDNETENRCYAITAGEPPYIDRGLIDRWPSDLIFGLGYPCLEDGNNNLATIKTGYETLELYPDQIELFNEIVVEGRAQLKARLTQLADRIENCTLHILGTDLRCVKAVGLQLIGAGLDPEKITGTIFANYSCFSKEQLTDKVVYELFKLRDLSGLTPREFTVALIRDFIDSLGQDSNFATEKEFERKIFAKYLLLMYINYVTTHEVFHGCHREDYGASGKSQQDSMMYRAAAAELEAFQEWRTNICDHHGWKPGMTIDVDLEFIPPETANSIYLESLSNPIRLNEAALLPMLHTIHAQAVLLNQKRLSNFGDFSDLEDPISLFAEPFDEQTLNSLHKFLRLLQKSRILEDVVRISEAMQMPIDRAKATLSNETKSAIVANIGELSDFVYIELVSLNEKWLMMKDLHPNDKNVTDYKVRLTATHIIANSIEPLFRAFQSRGIVDSDVPFPSHHLIEILPKIDTLRHQLYEKN